MHDLYLLLGSNLGERFEIIRAATDMITKEIGPVVKSSACYETEPWGNNNQGFFLNKVILLTSEESPAILLDKLLEIELRLGRRRDGTINSARTIDIDILLYGNMIVSDENLIIPHPRLHLRKFVLVPLVEIAPDLVHPVLNCSLNNLLINCSDNLNVTMYETFANFS